MGNWLSCFKSPSSMADQQQASAVEASDGKEMTQSTTTITSGQAVHSSSNGSCRPSSETCGRMSRRSDADGGSTNSNDSKVNALFDSYSDSEEPDCILAEGIERLCRDLQARPDEFRILVLAWKMNAEQMCRFTRGEFVQGCRDMRVDSVRGIRDRLPEYVSRLEREPELFKDLYRFTFRFGLDAAAGQRILPIDMAVCLWRLVFTVREPLILARWLRFLELHPQFRGIPKDTWNMFLNFSESVGDDLSSYDDTEAWPSLFDDFVEYENDHANQNISAKAKESDRLLQAADH